MRKKQKGLTQATTATTETQVVEVKKERSWFRQLSELAAWIAAIVFLFALFYNLLPVLLLLLGATIGLLGDGTTMPSLVDAVVFLLVGLSFTAVGTCGLIYVLKRILKRMNVVSRSLSEKWFGNRFKKART